MINADTGQANELNFVSVYVTMLLTLHLSYLLRANYHWNGLLEVVAQEKKPVGKRLFLQKD